jgi:sensor histidine kinase YesM
MQRNKLFIFFSVIIPLLSLSVFSALYLSAAIDFSLFKSYSLGVLIASINFLIGFIAIKIGLNKPNKSFLLIVFGAVVVRFFLIFVLIILTLSFLYVRMNSFIFTTFTFYFYFLIVEILYLKNQKILIKNE